ncbi:tRNA (adenosine(37)-N6)-threonylcarbamoyltransferase complex dimerization subunit type 1 TsaB [Patiriisocius marinistellae]|uniref:N(6)-L-threonylcarbamoyladenine synthase n=1 Tax=Patiriisocius marinistellae TaxID=2494560 RepID=A0A5J4FZ45_9FLAO|nr:tRNA (adenosine(37)-N6)-threonylcarbamoyltransferase complex dimerization subunit type 1 TsaB [Patiriisocius marinistellae]GEQ85295.1 tRNA (adenosine(37)-N6)-threonylcarbamoyltransferase complex dimerization subunit type 1 TsaB [Patiriisocius marinistellae]
MATILCIETATTNCSVALSVNGSVIALQEDNPQNKEGKKFSHAEKLHTYIGNVLDKASISKNEIDAIAVSKGPGSYTGLRIGVSAAKGLCYSLDVPLIAVSTLQSLAMQVNDNSTIVTMLDARRMEVYSAIFSSNKELLRETEAQIIDENSFETYLSLGNVTFIGDGVAKFKEICNHPNAIYRQDSLPSAKEMAQLAETKHKKNDTVDVAYFEPYYLKDFIAN